MPEIKQDIRTSTIVVASNTSLHKNDADYACGGVADELTINTALIEAVALGKKVSLLEGVYILAGPIVFPENNICLEGMDRATFIIGDALLTGNHAIELTRRTGCTIRGLAIRTEDGGGKVCHCIFAEDGCDNLSIENVFIDGSDSDGIHIEGTNTYDVSIVNCHVEGADDRGIHVNMDGGNLCNRLSIRDNTVLSAGDNGIEVLVGCDGADIINNTCQESAFHGIAVGAPGCQVHANHCVDNSQNAAGTCHGIELTADALNCQVDSNYCFGGPDHDMQGDGIHLAGEITNCSITGNYCYENVHIGIHLPDSGSESISIVGNYVYANGDEGILVEGDFHKINDNYVIDNSTSAAGGHAGISATGSGQINDNFCYPFGDNQSDGIWVAEGPYQIVGNDCASAKAGAMAGNGITLFECEACQVVGNFCSSNAGYGISISADSDLNYVKNNMLADNATGPFLDNGTNTQLDAYVVAFSHGSDPQDSGYLIDLDTEFARAWLRLPIEVQQVVRMKIYARAAAASGTTMALEINVNGGADNEPFNAHATAAPNTPSTSSNFAANDVIFWTLSSAEIVALLGGDSVEVKVLHEAANAGGVITNAYLRTVEFEYV